VVGQCEAEISTHLEHGLDTSVADLGTGCNDVLAALLVSETGLDELLSVLDKQVPDSLGFAELVKIASVGDKAVWDLLVKHGKQLVETGFGRGEF
jgi:hypothetical protein